MPPPSGSRSPSPWYGTPERRLEICSQTAVWFHSGQTPLPIRWVLLRDPHGQFEPQALLCTDPTQDPLAIIGWFVQRWPVEVTFREVRDHLGVETQRQWSDRAIARTTPCLLGLFSLVALFASPACAGHPPRGLDRQPGIASNSRPSPIPSPRYAARSGRRRVFRCPA